jgi:serine/threonine-protein kinase
MHSESPDGAARRFEREAKLGASLNHPNIVAVYDIVTDEDGVLIVMEYVDGRTLRLEMDSGPVTPARAIEVLYGVASGLDHAHGNGVVHRDVKPANVLIAHRDGAVKLTDLGIATAAERTHITGTGVVLGTAAYMAPERLDGHAGGSAADVYSLAAVAFEMLSGRKPITGRTPIEVARRVIEAPPPDLREVLPGAPPRAAEVLTRGLAKDPAERPATAGELVRELSAAYAGVVDGPPAAGGPSAGDRRHPSPPARSGPSPRDRAARPGGPPHDRAARPRPAWLAAGALAAIALAVLVVALTGGGGGVPGTGGPGARAHSQAARTRAHGPSKAPTPSTPPRAAPAPSPSPPARATAAAPTGSPAQALTGFYTRAAAQDFQGAWALGTGNLHSQFGSIGTFRATLATLRSISFPRMSVTSETGGAATVSFSSIAQHTDHVDDCTGQAALARQGSQWLVDHIGVTCTTTGGGRAPKKVKKPKDRIGPKNHKNPPKH